MTHRKSKTLSEPRDAVYLRDELGERSADAVVIVVFECHGGIPQPALALSGMVGVKRYTLFLQSACGSV